MMNFPLNYFATIVSPSACFRNRDYLSRIQRFLIILMLTGLMVLPLATTLGKIQNITLRDYTENSLLLITDDAWNEIRLAIEQHQDRDVVKTENQLFTYTTDNNRALPPNVTEAIVLSPDGFTIYEKDRPIIEQTAPVEHELSAISDSNKAVHWLSEQWAIANYMSIVLVNFVNVVFLFLVNSIMLVFGAGGFLYLGKYSGLIAIESYKQAVTVAFNCVGVPTLVASVVGWFGVQPTTMLLWQSIGFILMLLWSYWRTSFRDEVGGE